MWKYKCYKGTGQPKLYNVSVFLVLMLLQVIVYLDTASVHGTEHFTNKDMGKRSIAIEHKLKILSHY